MMTNFESFGIVNPIEIFIQKKASEYTSVGRLILILL